ncbi:MAG: type II secretion system F family protein [Candidatus Bilamarchaeum sp.]
MIKKLEKIIAVSPRLGLISSKQLIVAINTHYQNIDPARYIGFSLLVAIFCSILGLFIAPIFSLVIFAIVFGFFIFLPKIEIKNKETKIEQELADFLIGLGNSLEIGIETGKALKISSEGKGELKEEIEYCLRQAREGASLNRAIGNLSFRYDSLEIKRAVSAILLSLESGSDGSEIRNIGLDMRSIAFSKLKESSSKATMVGLVFVIISTMLPIFTIIYSTLGPSIGFATIEKEWILLTLLVLFPCLDLVLMLLTIQFSKSSNLVEPTLDMFGIFISIIIGTISNNIVILALGFICGIYIAKKHYYKEQKKEEIEKMLPDTLLAIGIMPKGVGLIKIIQTLIKNSSGQLRSELEITLKQIENNIGFRLALSDLYMRNDSQLLKRSCQMLEQLVETNNTDKISLLAQDLIITAQTLREKSVLFSMQKYTLLIGSLLLPLMLSSIINLAFSVEKINNTTKVLEKIEAAKFSIPTYLVIYSAMSAFVISTSEGKKSSFSIYLLIMSATSLFIFNFIKI